MTAGSWPDVLPRQPSTDILPRRLLHPGICGSRKSLLLRDDIHGVRHQNSPGGDRETDGRSDECGAWDDQSADGVSPPPVTEQASDDDIPS